MRSTYMKEIYVKILDYSYIKQCRLILLLSLTIILDKHPSLILHLSLPITLTLLQEQLTYCV